MSPSVHFILVAFLWAAGRVPLRQFLRILGAPRHAQELPGCRRTATITPTGVGQGVIWEYWDYIKWGVLLMWPPFLISWAAGIGWVIGTNAVRVLFGLLRHQLQHDNPARCFWMSMPIHHVHHRFNMWHYNFGMAVPWWDYVFRTYKPVEEAKWRKASTRAKPTEPLKIRWCVKHLPDCAKTRSSAAG